MIVGTGVDVVDVDRFGAILARSPRVASRLFTDRERHRDDGTPLSPRSLAGRFAVKEAVAKALGVPAGMAWHDCEILSDERGRPRLELAWTVAAAADEIGAGRWHVSVSHDGGVVVASVIAESGPP